MTASGAVAPLSAEKEAFPFPFNPATFLLYTVVAVCWWVRVGEGQGCGEQKLLATNPFSMFKQINTSPNLQTKPGLHSLK